MLSLLTASITALCFAPLALGHTWIEQLRNINEQGQYVGNYGYPRGYVDKPMQAAAKGGKSGEEMTWLLPRPTEKTNPFIGEDSVLCMPSQSKQRQDSADFPRLKVSPGSYFAMRYTENGHITLKDDATNLPKPEKGGTVFIYGTMEPKEDEKLVNVLRWTADGQGGDKRGILLATNNYDDGRCYELNGKPLSDERKVAGPNFALGQAQDDAPGNFPMLCESDAALPKDAPVGKPYTVYWVWQWNTMRGKNPSEPNGKDQYYTTCMDVDVVDTIVQSAEEPKFQMGQQDAMSIAVDNWSTRTALYTDPMAMEPGPIAMSSSSRSANQTSATTVPTASPNTTLVTQSSRLASRTSFVPVDGIPILTKRPGRPVPSQPSGANAGISSGPANQVTVTNTVILTVTAPAVSGQPSSPAKPLVHNGAKFRFLLA